MPVENDTGIDKILLEFLENPGEHPDRDAIVDKLNSDPEYVKTWHNLSTLQAVVKLALDDSSEPDTALTDNQLIAYFDNTDSETERTETRELLLRSRTARMKLAQLVETMHATENQAIRVPVGLVADAIALVEEPVSEKSEYLKNDRQEGSFSDWIAGLFGWRSAFAAVGVAALVFFFMYVMPMYSFPFGQADQKLASQVGELAPTEFKATAFHGSKPIEDLWPIRLGYFAALARDMKTTKLTENLQPQLELLKTIDTGIPNKILEQAASGVYPCRAIGGSDAQLCRLGSRLYYFLRSNRDADGELKQDLASAFLPHISLLPADLQNAISNPETMKDEVIQFIASTYLW